MDIIDTFKYYYGQDNMPKWLLTKLNELGDKKEHCLIFRVKDFKEIAETTMFKQANADCGSWGCTVWHKNHAIEFEKKSYRVIVGKDYDLFKMSWGPRFPMEWCKFAMELGSYNDFVLLTDNGAYCNGMVAKDLICPGGRLYHEPSAIKASWLEFQ